jgi:hypothetical protein
MRIFVIRDPIQNSGSRIKLMDKKEFIQTLKDMLDENGALGNLNLGYIDDDKEFDIVELDNDTVKVILDE